MKTRTIINIAKIPYSLIFIVAIIFGSLSKDTNHFIIAFMQVIILLLIYIYEEILINKEKGR